MEKCSPVFQVEKGKRHQCWVLRVPTAYKQIHILWQILFLGRKQLQLSPAKLSGLSKPELQECFYFQGNAVSELPSQQMCSLGPCHVPGLLGKATVTSHTQTLRLAVLGQVISPNPPVSGCNQLWVPGKSIGTGMSVILLPQKTGSIAITMWLRAVLNEGCCFCI